MGQAKTARQPQPLPPQIGTVNYDNERLFSIRPRFSGELVEITQVEEPGPSGSPVKRPLRYGDRVRQGDVLAVVYSRDLGEKKAALVDAVCSLRLSEETLKRHEELQREGALSLTALNTSRRQVQADSNAVLTAERTLLMWKLTDKEIQAIKEEAGIIHDQKLVRNADAEARKWGRVEIKVPEYSAEDRLQRELVIVEKNTNLNDMVDPGKDMPLFRVADLSRLQIWVHPPEEYLPVFRKMLESPAGGSGAWRIQFQSNPKDKLDLQFVQIAPSLEPNQHTPMLIGYLPNPNGTKYVIGQFVTATILLPPDRSTVEIPTAALNEVAGQALVFVQPDPRKLEYFLRRVSVVQRFKDVSFVRMEPTEEELARVEPGKFPVEPLRDGERVVTQGVVELTACLEDLRTKEGK
jgi:cobalt-zinc-cadmium efflux system membrane fusion protein